MKTPVKHSQAVLIICAHDFGPYVNEPVPDEDWLKSYSEKSNHDERLKQLQQRLDSSEELSKW